MKPRKAKTNRAWVASENVETLTKALQRRKAWKESVKACQICNTRPPVECHEINRGSALRQRALFIPATWLAVCRPCHNELGKASIWPLAAQLAVKKIREPDVYDRLVVLRARVVGGHPHRMDNSVTEKEVDGWVQVLRSGCYGTFN